MGKEFTIVNLALNLRNTKEISKKALSVAEQSLFQYANGLLKPPSNFPQGPNPVYVESFDEAIFRVRLQTKKGILLVSDDAGVTFQTKEKVKYYQYYQRDFSATQNPIDFLNNGNILVTSRRFLSGFEWPVVIYKHVKNGERDVESHDCNIISRCTSLLYIFGEEDRSVKSFPFIEISSLLEITISDGTPLSKLKDYMSKYIADHLNRFNRRKWLQNLLPILKKTIEQISQAQSETITFSVLEDLLHFLLKDLWSYYNKSWLLFPCKMNRISISLL